MASQAETELLESYILNGNMNYHFVHLQLTSFIFIEKLAQRVNLPEKVDYDCEFIGAIDNKYNLVGVAGINFKKCKLPRFEHIIILPEYQKTRLGITLMLKAEEAIKERGFSQYLAFIFNDNLLMQRYASKWGFNILEKREDGNWYIKKIELKEREYAMA